MSFKKGHPFYQGGEKGWFKKGHIPFCAGTAKIVKKNCKFCNKEFDNPAGQKRQFCSNVCSGKFRKSFGVKIRIKKICDYCKKEFVVVPSKKRLKCCSKKCSSKNSKGREMSIATKKRLAEANSKEKHPQWKGGVTWDKEYQRKQHKEYRHRLGISKKYNDGLGISKTKEYKRLQQQKRKALIRGGGDLTLKTIQLVYEDNIKQYGTLTCYLCLKPIPFGKDNLEHKIPLSRGGTNEYNNLAIACRKCNCSKNNKTEKEYRKLEAVNVS